MMTCFHDDDGDGDDNRGVPTRVVAEHPRKSCESLNVLRVPERTLLLSNNIVNILSKYIVESYCSIMLWNQKEGILRQSMIIVVKKS